MDEQLAKFIKDALAKGKTQEQIASELKTAGWSDAQISEAIKTATTPAAPPAPASQPSAPPPPSPAPSAMSQVASTGVKVAKKAFSWGKWLAISGAVVATVATAWLIKVNVMDKTSDTAKEQTWPAGQPKDYTQICDADADGNPITCRVVANKDFVQPSNAECKVDADGGRRCIVRAEGASSYPANDSFQPFICDVPGDAKQVLEANSAGMRITVDQGGSTEKWWIFKNAAYYYNKNVWEGDLEDIKGFGDCEWIRMGQDADSSWMLSPWLRKGFEQSGSTCKDADVPASRMETPGKICDFANYPVAPGFTLPQSPTL